MLFLNSPDQTKRDELINEIIQSKRNIQQNNLNERLGNIEMKREMTKVFEPITESQQKATEVTEKGFTDTQKAIAEMPKQLALSSEALSQVLPTIGSTAANYLKTYLGKTTGDNKFGIYTKGDKFYIGNKEVKIADNDIIIGEERYKGTPGLWELITSKDPKNYSQEDKTSYSNILYSTNAMYVDYDSTKRPSSSHGSKWKNILSDMWKSRPLAIKEIPSVSTNTQTLSSTDPNELVKRFALLLANKEAGHTGVNDEMMQIADQLYKLNQINDEQYQTMINQAQTQN
jgi:hypothetical protein